MKTLLEIIILLLLITLMSFFAYGQTDINFDNKNWNATQLIGTSFVTDGFRFVSDGLMATNYGFNLDVNTVSLYYYFGYNGASYISISPVDNLPFNLNSFSAYQVSEVSFDTLYVEGWYNDIKLYETHFYNIDSWKVLTLNYINVTKVIFKVNSTGISDYNFDFLIIDHDIISPQINDAYITNKGVIE